MFNPANQLVPQPWNYCNILRDGGVSCRDYMNQDRIENAIDLLKNLFGKTSAPCISLNASHKLTKSDPKNFI